MGLIQNLRPEGGDLNTTIICKLVDKKLVPLIEEELKLVNMIDYNYYVQYQDNLKKALQLLEDNTSTNNYCEEAITIIKSLMTYKDIYKKKYGENTYVLVGKLTSKNEILFDIPLSSNLKTNDNKAKSVGVYSYEWYYLELEIKGEEKAMKYVPMAPYEVTNRYSFNQLVYPKNPHYLARDEDPVLGYSLGDWKNAEVVFYDQYILTKQESITTP